MAHTREGYISPGQQAYEADVAKTPLYHDGTPRKAWSELHAVARWSWERNPTPRQRIQPHARRGDTRRHGMTRSKEITNSEDVIDSRDVIGRIEYLESERDGLEGEALAEWNESDEANELKALQALADEASGSPDWTYGKALIRDSYFEEYARELADDIGAVPDNLSWPCTCIDWEQAAWELQMDYMSVDFDGITYWIRA